MAGNGAPKPNCFAACGRRWFRVALSGSRHPAAPAASGWCALGRNARRSGGAPSCLIARWARGTDLPASRLSEWRVRCACACARGWQHAVGRKRITGGVRPHRTRHDARGASSHSRNVPGNRNHTPSHVRTQSTLSVTVPRHQRPHRPHHDHLPSPEPKYCPLAAALKYYDFTGPYLGHQ